MIGNMVEKVLSKTIGIDLVEVKPMSRPIDHVYFMDFIYRDLVKERQEKIGKLLDNMEQRKKVV